MDTPSQTTTPVDPQPEEKENPLVHILRFVATVLWRWPVIVFLAGIIAAIGLGALYGDDYIVARFCFFVAVAWVTARGVTDAEVKGHDYKKAIAVMVIVAGILVFGSSI
ncbi:MAG: hypothetical protein WA354_13290 [Terracidiphilus sp.]